ncbi:response regulator transcription factor [Variovorax sp. DT-64]|uniref:response regulator transcription factor n=1 Tax=Variovorax sp. DT-64 TaxID=3396160 RepID=UPI003F199A7E
MTTTSPIVYIVDDDASFLKSMARLLSASGFMVRTHASASDFLVHFDNDTPGCVVTDLEMPELTGLDLQLALAHTPNPLPLLFLTGHGDIASTVRAMREGAEDFLEKRAPKEELLDAVRRALERGAHERQARVRRSGLRAAFDTLTAREHEVLAHVLRGRLNKQMAGDLGINERTVKLHRTALMIKLGVRSVAALTRLAQEAGILNDEPLQTFPYGQ